MLSGLCSGNLPRRLIRAALGASAGLSVLVVASASGPVVTLNGGKGMSAKAAETPKFKFYLEAFSTQSLIDELRGVDPVHNTDLSGTPYSRNVIDISGWKLGRYRRQGPHLIAMQNRNLTQHMVALSQQVPTLVPADFTGPVVIDYEPWWALWERTPNNASSAEVDALDGDYKDDWRDYIRAERPYLLDGLDPDEQESVYKRTYESFVRTFLLATYYKCKSLRPRAQWSFYNYPQVLINSDLTPPGVKGYGDLTHRASQLNDETAWFYETVDFVAPRIYPTLKVLDHWPPAERRPGEISPSVHEAWLSSMVRESVRLARGKPVLPVHSAIYFSPHSFGLQPVSSYQHEEVYRILAENGAAGIIVWHAVANTEELDKWNQLWESDLKPAGINSDRVINGSGPGASGS